VGAPIHTGALRRFAISPSGAVYARPRLNTTPVYVNQISVDMVLFRFAGIRNL